MTEKRKIYLREYVKDHPNIKAYKKIYMRKWRKKNGTHKDKLRKKIWYELKCGRLEKCPCEICGKKKVEVHHDDYRKPNKIRFLCRIHHRERDVLMGKRKN